MPKKTRGIDNVFHNLKITHTTVEVVLQEWMAAAGITKHITYHCSRHTAATMLLTLGASIYVVSKIKERPLKNGNRSLYLEYYETGFRKRIAGYLKRTDQTDILLKDVGKDEVCGLFDYMRNKYRNKRQIKTEEESVNQQFCLTKGASLHYVETTFPKNVDLKFAGYRDVAKLTGKGVSTVQRVKKEFFETPKITKC